MKRKLCAVCNKKRTTQVVCRSCNRKLKAIAETMRANELEQDNASLQASI